MRKLVNGAFYRDYKGKLYQVAMTANYKEEQKIFVIYQALYDDFQWYATPLEQFLSEVDYEKYPESKQKYQFELVEQDELMQQNNFKKEQAVQQKQAQTSLIQQNEESQHNIYTQTIKKMQQTEENLKKEDIKEKKLEEKNLEERNLEGKNRKEDFKKEDLEKENLEQETLKESEILKEQETLKEPELDKNLAAFLDARDYTEKLEVLYAIRKNLNEYLMSSIEISLDLPVGTESMEERLELVRRNLQALARFECNRLR